MAVPSKGLATLAGVFFLELMLALGGSFFAFFVTGMGAGGCSESSCLDQLGRAMLLLIIVIPALLVVCCAAFLWAVWKKRVEVNRLAVLVLAIGTLTTWVVWLVMIDSA